MKYRLFCIDLDGTLLTDEKEIGSRDIEAIRNVSEQGIKIALVTGRMPAATDRIARQLMVPCIMACNAGTYIMKENQCIYAEYLSARTMLEVYDIVTSFGLPLWIFRDREWYVTQKDRFVRKEEKLVDCVAKKMPAKELAGYWYDGKTGPNKLLVGAEPWMIQKVYNVLKKRQDVDIACSSENYLEIFPAGMDKGKALRIICGKEGIGIEDTVAFGDQELDIPMLKAAGTSVAMGNAIEELKRQADYVTKSNNEDGIACAIENYLR